MKRLTTITIFLLLTTLFANAQTTYTLVDNDVVVINGIIDSCSYDFAIKNIIIPDALDGQAVIGIADKQRGVFQNKGIIDVKLPSTLEYIGDAAFKSNELTIISLPNSVTYIGIVAFAYNELEDLTIPNSLDSIRFFAFGENRLTSLNLPNSVNYIGNEAFRANSLTSLNIPNSVTYIGKTAFDHNELENLAIPNSIIYIGDDAFRNNNLTSLSIPNSVTYIGDDAFLRNDLTNVTFDANSNIYKIGKSAFSENTGLTSVTLPTHANPAFIEYLDETGTKYNEGDYLTDFSLAYRSVIPYTLIDDDVVVINGIIESCSYDFTLKDIIIPETLDGQIVIGIADIYLVEGTYGMIYTDGIFEWKGILSIKLPSTLEHIGDGAFSSNELTSLSIPNNVTYIGVWAFDFNQLTSILLPNSVTSVEGRAFFGNELTSVTFETNSNIANIGEYAFYDNTGLTSVTLPTHANPAFVEYIDRNGKSYNEGDTLPDFKLAYHAVIPYTLTNADVVVTNGIIESCSYEFALKDIIIPEILDGQSVIGISGNFWLTNIPFYNKGIISVQFPSTLEYIGEYAFKDNDFFSLTIPNNVTFIGYGAFGSCNLTIITFEENSNIESIVEYAFHGNNAANGGGLSSIALPTHANSGFTNYQDGYGNIYFPDDNITDFSTSYEAVILTNTQTVNDYSNKLLLYPNPSKGKINIKVDAPLRSNIDVYIFDFRGTKIFQTHYRNPEIVSFDMSEFTSGLYFAKVVVDNNEFMKKFVLE